MLLTIEDKCRPNKPWVYEYINFESEYLAEYSHEEILYHIQQSQQAGLIQGVFYYDNGKTVLISDLTPHGHEFLANIRNESIWKKTLSQATGASLSILLEVAKNVAVKHFLG